MTRESDGRGVERRRIVQTIGGLGALGLAGCLGSEDDSGDGGSDDAGGDSSNGDDNGDGNGDNGNGNGGNGNGNGGNGNAENGDEENGNEENGDDGNGDEENGGGGAPASFEIVDHEPGNTRILHDEPLDITATIENTGDHEGTQTFIFVFEGETRNTASVTLDGGENETISFGIDESELEYGNLYDYSISSQDDGIDATVTVDPDFLQAPYGLNLGGPPQETEQQSELPIVKDGLEFEDMTIDEVDEFEYVTLYGEEHPDEEVNEWLEPPVTYPPETDQEIQGTDHPAMYHTYFFGWNFDIEFTIENGTYDVTIYNSENYFGSQEDGGEGSRVFDIIVQGETVVEEYDIYAEVGGHTPHTVTAEGVEVEDETLLVETETHEDFSKIAAVEIREA